MGESTYGVGRIDEGISIMVSSTELEAWLCQSKLLGKSDVGKIPLFGGVGGKGGIVGVLLFAFGRFTWKTRNEILRL